MRAATDRWTPADLPDLVGRTVVVTGPSPGGLGQFTVLELARHRARVVLAGRRPERLAETRAAVLADVPRAVLDEVVIDLADLASVRRAAAELAGLGPLHVLVNNAGVMGTPYHRTGDGLELQMATNHLGPFLLTGLLLPQLVAGGDGRVVTVSSQMHRYAARRAPLDDPRSQQRRYERWSAYGQTKLANLLFTYELERRLRRTGLPVRALAAHPGFASTHLAANGQYGRATGGRASILDAAIKAVSPSTPAHGAWPTLMASTADLPGGTYVGPDGLFEWRGAPRVTDSSRLSHDETAQRRLWQLSEEVTGLRYP